MIDRPNRNQRDRKIPGDPMRDQYAANERIRCQSVRVIDSDGNNLGILETYKSIKLAKDVGLDLVLISPTVDPPVARICDYNKFIYEQKQSKKEQDKKLRQSAISTKEIQLRPVIGIHDLDVKAKHAKEWLDDNCKIKIVVKFKGREMAHNSKGFEVIRSFIDRLGECKIEKNPEMNSNMIVAIISPARDSKNTK